MGVKTFPFAQAGEYAQFMLGPGDAVPVARVWTAPDEQPTLVQDAIGDGRVLLCFYLFDWSPT